MLFLTYVIADRHSSGVHSHINILYSIVFDPYYKHLAPRCYCCHSISLHWKQ